MVRKRRFIFDRNFKRNFRGGKIRSNLKMENPSAMKRNASPFNKFNREKGSPFVSLIKNRISSSLCVPPSSPPCICNAAPVIIIISWFFVTKGSKVVTMTGWFVERCCPPTGNHRENRSGWKTSCRRKHSISVGKRGEQTRGTRWTLTLAGRMAATKNSFIEINRSF